jgi:HD superfamily phosphodiesterase
MGNLIPTLERLARERLENWPPRWERYHWPGYTYDHTLRVRNLAVAMATKEGADPVIV